MKATFREKILLLVLAIAVVLYVGVRFLAAPAWDAFSQSRQALDDAKEQELLARGRVAAAANAGKNRQKALDAATSAANGLLPEMTKEEIHLFLVPLAQAQGLNVTSLTLGDPTAADVSVSTASGTQDTEYLLKQYAQRAGGQAAASSAASSTSSQPAGGASSTSSGTQQAASSASASSTPASSESASSSSSSAVKKTGALLAYPVSLTAQCSLAQLQSFLDTVQGTGHSILVNNVQFSPQGAGSVSLSLTFYCARKPDAQQ